MPELDQSLIKKLFHLGERTAVDLENPVPALGEPAQLADLAILQKFETLVQKIIEKDDGELALLGRRVLEDILLPEYPQLKQEQPEIYERYERLIVLLKFINLVTRGIPQISELIEQHIIDALQAGIPVKNKFEEVLEDYDDMLLGGTIAQALANALSKSTQPLGQAPIALKGENRPVRPTVANFLTDYFQATLPPPGRMQRVGAVERITYLNQSPNVRSLSKDNKDVLLRVLELYDWLRFGSVEYAEARASVGVPGGSTYTRGESLAIPKQARSLPPPPRPVRPSVETRVVPPPKPAAQAGITRETVPSQSPPSLSPFGRSLRREGEKAGGERVPRTTALNEDLYRETLAELARQRAEAQKTPERAREISVNEALIRAGQKEIPSDHGQVTAGEKDVEEKLRKLEDKLK